MKNTPQLTITKVPSGIAIRGPFHPNNNEVFRELHGHFERDARRWILLPTAACQSKIIELFGANSPNVIAQVPPNLLSVVGRQLILGGYVVAEFDDRKNSIRMPAGVEIAAGDWDINESREKSYPCMSGGNPSLKIVVRKEYAKTHGLNIQEELGEEEVSNPLEPFADSDLKEELEKRGYRIDKPKPDVSKLSFF